METEVAGGWAVLSAARMSCQSIIMLRSGASSRMVKNAIILRRPSAGGGGGEVGGGGVGVGGERGGGDCEHGVSGTGGGGSVGGGDGRGAGGGCGKDGSGGGAGGAGVESGRPSRAAAGLELTSRRVLVPTSEVRPEAWQQTGIGELLAFQESARRMETR